MGSHLIISIDDVGTIGIPSYAAEEGVTHVPAMPNLALLEAQGVRFSRATSATVCGVARMQMYTSRYGFNTGMGSNASLSSNGPPQTSEVMMPEVMTAHKTAMFGKWHLSTLDNGQNDAPITVGKFDQFDGIIRNISAVTSDSYFYWLKASGTKVSGTVSEVRIGSPDKNNRTPADYLTKHINDDAMAWLTANEIANPGSDWIVWINHQTPHNPLHQPNTSAERGALPDHMSALMEAVTTAYLEIALGTDVTANTAYLEGLSPPWVVGGTNDETLAAFNIAMIETWDYELGLLLAHAEVDLALNSDVTIWFFSDNGPEPSVVQQPFDSTHAKGEQFELGVRIPFVVAGNGVATTEKGKTCRRLVSVVDIPASIALIESKVMPNADGVNISPYLLDVEERTRVRDYAYTEIFTPSVTITDAKSSTITTWDRSIQDEGWKLITKMPTGPASKLKDITYELYNIKGGDRQEATNLIQDNLLTLAGVNHCPEVFEALTRLIAAEAALLP